jgi:DNA-binding MarR family transcriptional regulator
MTPRSRERDPAVAPDDPPLPPISDPEQRRTLLREFFAGVVMYSQAVADRVGIGASDLHCLNVLNLAGPISAGALSAMTGLTSGAVTRMVDRLEQAGLVERDRDPVDRRKVIVKRSNSSSDEIRTSFTVLGRRIGAVLAGMSAEEQATVDRFLRACNPLFLEAIHELRGEGALTSTSVRATVRRGNERPSARSAVRPVSSLSGHSGDRAADTLRR